jgi:prepilin-type N-terminal cleavage/methylation domain-containing protein
VRAKLKRYAGSQGGFTLVELLIASAIGVVVMTGLTSVVLTTWRANTIATSRVDASSQIRNFEFSAYDDFAHSDLSGLGSCTNQAPCSTQPIVLTGTQLNNSGQPISGYQITYAWDGSSFLDRHVAANGATAHTATDVSAFSWYLDTTSTHPTVVVTISVTIQAYTETQTLRFYPRVNP